MGYTVAKLYFFFFANYSKCRALAESMQMKQVESETKSAGQIVVKTVAATGWQNLALAKSPRDLRVEHAKCVYTLSPFCQFDLFVCR